MLALIVLKDLALPHNPIIETTMVKAQLDIWRLPKGSPFAVKIILGNGGISGKRNLLGKAVVRSLVV
jgi:hypothetical protein